MELWEPRTDVVPSGFDFKEPLPLALHNRWFSGTNNTYINSLGFAGSFIVEKAVDFASSPTSWARRRPGAWCYTNRTGS